MARRALEIERACTGVGAVEGSIGCGTEPIADRHEGP